MGTKFLNKDQILNFDTTVLFQQPSMLLNVFLATFHTLQLFLEKSLPA